MTIVTAIDCLNESDDIVEEARQLGNKFGDDLHVVHVLGRSEFVELERTSVEDTGKPIQLDRVKEIAADIAAEAVDEGVDVRSVGLVGDAADEILRYADERDARYIVIGGRKRSPVGKAIFGSVTQSILLEAKRPVVTVMQAEKSG